MLCVCFDLHSIFISCLSLLVHWLGTIFPSDDWAASLRGTWKKILIKSLLSIWLVIMKWSCGCCTSHSSSSMEVIGSHSRLFVVCHKMWKISARWLAYVCFSLSGGIIGWFWTPSCIMLIFSNIPIFTNNCSWPKQKDFFLSVMWLLFSWY